MGLFCEIFVSVYILCLVSFDVLVSYEDWKVINVQVLIIGVVSVQGGKVVVKFWLFDVFLGQFLGDGMQFDVGIGNWWCVVYKVVDQVYVCLIGESFYFDSCVIFVQEIGFKDVWMKCIGIMDYDGVNVKYLIDNLVLVLKLCFLLDGLCIFYISYVIGFLQVVMMDVNMLVQCQLSVGQ